MRRKGELSPAAVDRGWPHQVAVPARISVGDGYKLVHDFCKELSLCSRGHSFKRDREWWNVVCFAEREHAENSDAWADTTTPHGQLMITILPGLATFERHLILQRTGEGRARAKARGIRFGRNLR